MHDIYNAKIKYIQQERMLKYTIEGKKLPIGNDA